MAVDALLFVLELACVALVVAGVALWSVPAACVAAGVMGVIVLERTQASRRRGARR
ncbi:hypothetical protein [Streptomyces sp. NPDC051310]|uniref:hypothetical protein n=1 Tax=Streptomyces sp. NPDC051310 TaxID=3365649 RepID=UPI0037B32CB2